jgi:hypothetical protein
MRDRQHGKKRWQPILLTGLLLLISGAVPVHGQYGGAGWYIYECPQKFDESEFQWIQRCDAEFAPRAAAKRREAARQRAEFERMKVTLLKQPALPPERNALIGTWAQAPRPRRPAAGTDPFAALLGIADGCELLFGANGQVEFRADRYLVTDASGTDDLGALDYRAGPPNVAFAMPRVGVEMLAVQFETADRFRVINSLTPCVMFRSAGASSAAGRTQGGGASRTPQTPGARSGQSAPASGGARAASASAQSAAGAVFNDPLLTFNDSSMGYECADGQKPIVVSCETESQTVPALCKVLYADKPLSRSGFQMTDTVPRSVMLTKVRGCTPRKVTADAQGNLRFVP